MHCDNAFTGSHGLQLAHSMDNIGYDCIILDVNLPVIDGLTVCKTLRNAGISTPIIMLTARDRLDDKLAGFSNGADDYLCKPFEIKELVARIKTLTKRSRHNSILSCEDLTMDMANKVVCRGTRKIALSMIEWKILRLLLANQPNPVNKQKIIFEIWGDSPPETDSLKVHIHNLRKHIDFPDEKPLLHTFSGHGYAICMESYPQTSK